MVLIYFKDLIDLENFELNEKLVCCYGILKLWMLMLLVFMFFIGLDCYRMFEFLIGDFYNIV